MRRKNASRISREDDTAKVSILALVANMRCPNCQKLLPVLRLWYTNPRGFWNRFAGHECRNCKSIVFLSGQNRELRNVTVNLPLLFGTFYLGAWATTKIEGLHQVHPSRYTIEPNEQGFLLIMLVFFIIHIALYRFERISILQPKETET